MPKRITNAQFVERLKEVNPALEPLGEYHGMKGVVEVLCHDCGQTFSMEARRLLENGACPEHGDRRAKVRAALRERNAAGAKTQARFEAEVAEANPGITVTGAYAGCDAKVACACARGHGLSVKATLLARPGFECPVCKREDAWARKDAGFRAWLAGANPRIVPLEPFRGDTVAIPFRCEDCGEPFDAEPRLLRRAAACPNCGARPKKGPARLGHDEFVARVAKASPGVTVVGAYVTHDTKVACTCARGHSWLAEPRNLLRGEGCRMCSRTQTSYAEQYLLLALRCSLGADQVLSRDTETIGVELDVYAPSRNYAVEIGSWYWHRNPAVVARDREKRTLCDAAGIDLMTVYTDFDDDAELPLEGAWYYEEDLGNPQNARVLEQLADAVVERAGGRPLTREEHDEIAYLARAGSRRGAADGAEAA